jgi:hypothetical protein
VFDPELAKKAMAKLIDETKRGVVKWYHWGATDPDNYEIPPDGKYGLYSTFPNWNVYYTKIVGTHVTIERHGDDYKFCVYWGSPVGSGGSIMDMEKELPLMDELIDVVRDSNPEHLSKSAFVWSEKNKDKWWMKQEHIFHDDFPRKPFRGGMGTANLNFLRNI